MAAQRIAKRMRSEYLKAVLRQEIEYFDMQTNITSNTNSAVANDCSLIQDVLCDKVPGFLTNGATFMGMYAVGIVIMGEVAGVGIPMGVVLVIPGLVYGRSVVGMARKMKVEYGKAGGIVEEAVSCIRTVYSCGGEDKTVEEYCRALEGVVEKGIKLAAAKGVAVGSNAAVYGIWALIAYIGSTLVLHHRASGGDIFAVGNCIISSGRQLEACVGHLRSMGEAIAAAERIIEVTKRVPKTEAKEGESLYMDNIKRASGVEIEFREVEFAYPTRKETQVLKGFSLRLGEGETVALVGRSGSVKTTVLSLLQRLYEVDGGEITIGGVGIRKAMVEWVRLQIGVVTQQPALFATSIKNNIAWGRNGDVSMAEIVSAATAANAHHFISNLPLGYNTPVGEKGVLLSGGEKQRIAIARALIRNPPILLLDEITAPLDSISLHHPLRSIQTATAGRTSVIVSHRLSTILSSAVIAVVSDGRVVESGSHHTLSSLPNSLYSSMLRHHQVHPFTADVTSIQLPQTATASSAAAIQLHHVETSTRPFRRMVASFTAQELKHAGWGCICAAASGAVQPTCGFLMGSLLSSFFLQDVEEMKNTTRNLSLAFMGLAILSFAVSFGQHFSFRVMAEC